MTLLRLLATALGSLIGILLGVLLYGQALEKGWSIHDEVKIMAPITTIHTLVNTPKAWISWGRYNTGETIDYETWGPEMGAHAGFRWHGNDKSGSLEITKSDPKFGIDYQITGWGDGPAHGRISYQEFSDHIVVSWEDNGDLGLLGGYVSSDYKAQKQKYIRNSLHNLKQMAEHYNDQTLGSERKGSIKVW